MPVRHRRSARPPESLGSAGRIRRLMQPARRGTRLATPWSVDALTVDGRKPRARASLDITGVLCLLRRAGFAPPSVRCPTAPDHDARLAPCPGDPRATPRRRRRAPRRRHRARVRNAIALCGDARACGTSRHHTPARPHNCSARPRLAPPQPPPLAAMPPPPLPLENHRGIAKHVTAKQSSTPVRRRPTRRFQK